MLPYESVLLHNHICLRVANAAWTGGRHGARESQRSPAKRLRVFTLQV